MPDEQAALGVYETHTAAENAIKELQLAGFNMKQLSIVGQGYHTEENVTGFYNMKDRMKLWGKMGALWGGIWGWIAGSALFVLPGIGPVMVGGPMITMMVAAVEGAVALGGMSALGAVIASLGVPKNSILDYETAIQAEKFLLIVHGGDDDVRRAREILYVTGAQSVHSQPPMETVGSV
jgi:hypothetical protein